jgi:excisionase family DNA binding protein
MKEWITTAQAAQQTGYHPEYLRELIRTRKILGKKFGPVWQVNQASLLAYLQSTEKQKDQRHGPRGSGV